MKVGAQTHNVAEVDAPSGARYRRGNDGLFDMADSDAIAMARGGGFLPSLTGTARRRVGFRCTGCGHGSFFRTCGKCGADCEREG